MRFFTDERRQSLLLRSSILLLGFFALTACSSVRRSPEAVKEVTPKEVAPKESAKEAATDGSPSTVTSTTLTDPVPGATGAAPTAPLATPARSAREEELEHQVKMLNAKVEVLEARLSVLPLESEGKRLRGTPVNAHPADGGGTRVKTAPVPTDPEAGFVNDEAVQIFRRAMVLHRAGKYSESLMRFSGFLERFPDHPLAGAAQFYMGNSYFMQQEYKLALQEYQRVLTSYDRSSLVARTLAEMAQAEDRLQRTTEAARHRQLLNSLFPHSPFASESVAAAGANAGTSSTDSSSAPTTSTTPTAPTSSKSIDPVPGETEH